MAYMAHPLGTPLIGCESMRRYASTRQKVFRHACRVNTQQLRPEAGRGVQGAGDPHLEAGAVLRGHEGRRGRRLFVVIS